MAEPSRIPLSVALPVLPRTPDECPAWAARLTAALAAHFRRFGQATATGLAGAGGGAPGAQGVPGVAAFLAAEPGYDGEPGPPGNPGAAGATGGVGPSGPAVFLIADAVEGDAGPPGTRGADGPPGVDGAPGTAGPPGADGESGGGDFALLGPPQALPLQVNEAAIPGADFSDTLPSPPEGSNVRWQADPTTSPALVSAYVREAAAAVKGVLRLTGHLGGSATTPDVRGLRETSGPTLLTMAGVVDGQFLKRVGGTITSAAPITGPDGPQGAPGPAVFLAAESGEDGLIGPPGAPGPQGAAGTGISLGLAEAMALGMNLS